VINDYKFEKLMNFFKQNQGNKIRLTYAEIEKIIGFKLCSSAYKHKPYWSPTKTHTITRSWLENGWKISHLELGEYIEFKRICGCDFN
jgi:hypothetical protein